MRTVRILKGTALIPVTLLTVWLLYNLIGDGAWLWGGLVAVLIGFGFVQGIANRGPSSVDPHALGHAVRRFARR